MFCCFNLGLDGRRFGFLLVSWWKSFADNLFAMRNRIKGWSRRSRRKQRTSLASTLVSPWSWGRLEGADFTAVEELVSCERGLLQLRAEAEIEGEIIFFRGSRGFRFGSTRPFFPGKRNRRRIDAAAAGIMVVIIIIHHEVAIKFLIKLRNARGTRGGAGVVVLAETSWGWRSARLRTWSRAVKIELHASWSLCSRYHYLHLYPSLPFCTLWFDSMISAI